MSRSFVPIELGHTPLTDVRSLFGSALFHAFVVLLCSLTILNGVMPLS